MEQCVIGQVGPESTSDASGFLREGWRVRGWGGGIRGMEKAVDSRLGFLRYAAVRVAAFDFEKSSNLLSGFSEADTSPRLIT